jgi:hypothetical protein
VRSFEAISSPATCFTCPEPQLIACRFHPLIRAPMVALHHGDALVSGLIHDRGVVGAVLLGLGDKPARSEWPAMSPVGMPAAAAARLSTIATDCALSRFGLTLP